MVASAAAQLEAARRLLHGVLGDLWATCLRGAPVTDVQRAHVFESGLHAAQTAKAVVTSMYEAAGASALYVDCPLERAHRDIYAAMQHVQLAPLWLEDAGRVRLGLPPQHPFFGL
jgi:alkylation response protein AidB-like acyl-CoA dehydrogenase